MKCGQHLKECLLVCTSCDNAFVCSQCLNEDHRGHSVSSFDDATEEARILLQRLSTQNKNDLTELKSQVSRIDVLEIEQNEFAKTFAQTIESRKHKIYTVLDRTADAIINESEEIRQNNCDFLDNQASPLKQQISEVQALQKEVESTLNKSPIELIQNAGGLTSLPPFSTSITVPNTVQITDSVILSSLVRALLLGETSNTEVAGNVQEFRGTVPADDMSETINQGSDFDGMVRKKPFVECEFQYSQNSKVTVIKRYDSQKCWVKCKGEKCVKLIDRTGSVHRAIGFDSEKIREFCLGINGSLFLCSEGPNCIKEVSLPQMDVATFCHTGKLFPNGIASSSSGDLFVILVDSLLFAMTKQSQRLLVKYDKKGNEISRIGHCGYIRNIFGVPWSVQINHDGKTIAVLNNESKNLCYLILFDDNINLKLRYFGSGNIVNGNEPLAFSTANMQFFVSDVRFNSQNNMVISESFSKSVQLLSQSCDVISTVFVDDLKPYCLCLVSDDEVWVGYEDGRLKVWTI